MLGEEVDVGLRGACEICCEHGCAGVAASDIEGEREDRMVFEVLTDWEVNPLGFSGEIDTHAAAFDYVNLIARSNPGVVEDSGSRKGSGCENDAAA